jgi:two-component system chemotaxis response regulator CheB
LKTIDCSGPVVSIIDFSVKGGCCPSVDPRLESFESVYGRKAFGVVLSSMGRDGSEGARRLRDAGDLFFEHHELSSAVFGMPIYISQQRPWESARMGDW